MNWPRRSTQRGSKRRHRCIQLPLCVRSLHLAAQASEIVVSPSSLTGSIGVYMLHEDDSAALDAAGIRLELIGYGENKAETNNLGPLSDTAPAHLQGIVNGFGVAFEKAVARGRGIKQDEVHNKFGGGRVFDAKTAVRIGMAHRVATLTDVLTAPPSLSTSASRRWAQFAAMPASAAAKKRKAEFARMRHQLLMAKNGTVAAPNGGIDPPAPTIIHRV